MISIKVKKRDGSLVTFDKSKITSAIDGAARECFYNDINMCNDIANIITDRIKKIDSPIITIEEIQDLVENTLIEIGYIDIAKRYILYRQEKLYERGVKDNKEYKLLSKSFLSKYKHLPDPFPTELGAFIYLRTYSRWLPEKNRRERWWETVARAVDYNCSLVPTTRAEAEELYDNVFNLKQFLSGRTFWSGGTQVTQDFPTSNYNCAFEVIDELKAFSDLFYLLMVGAGVGVRILKDDVSKISKVRSNYNLINEYYNPVSQEERDENTSLIFENENTAKIIVGDSKSGWVKSLDFFFKLISDNDYKHIKNIIVNYNNVRPKGERLKTFGG
jgi:ribonucleoside-diphosphate reductase alpha chain/ribonucleoside-triphosphate reductase